MSTSHMIEWEYKTLPELGSIGRGKSKHRPRSDVVLYGGKYPFIQTSDIKHANFYVNAYSQTYNDIGLAQSKLWQADTLCMTIAANIAETAILKFPACFPDSIVGFVSDPNKSNVKFVKYALDQAKREFQKSAKGTAQDNLSLVKIDCLKLKVPNVEIQSMIALIISTYDDLIEANEKRIKILEEIAQLLYTEWFVKFRFPGYENVKMVDSGTEYGIVPDGWQIKNLLDSKIFLPCKDRIKKFDGEKLYFDTSCIDGIKIIKESSTVNWEIIPSRAQFAPVYNSVWFARMSNTYKVLVFDKSSSYEISNYLLSSGMFGLATEEKYLGFLFTLIKSEVFHKQKDSRATGATQISLTDEGFAAIRILFPSFELIEKYSNLVNRNIGQILSLQRQNKNLLKIRDFIIPQLVTGKRELCNH